MINRTCSKILFLYNLYTQNSFRMVSLYDFIMDKFFIFLNIIYYSNFIFFWRFRFRISFVRMRYHPYLLITLRILIFLFVSECISHRIILNIVTFIFSWRYSFAYSKLFYFREKWSISWGIIGFFMTFIICSLRFWRKRACFFFALYNSLNRLFYLL